MPRITRIYTRGGDDGSTGLGGGQRVRKHSLRIEAFGTVDELNSFIGLARSGDLDAELNTFLGGVQNDLFHLGSDLCFLEEDKAKTTVPQIGQRHIDELEALLDKLSAALGPLENFILPGGSPGAARLHVARTICRRAERIVVALAEQEPIGEYTVKYLNRLSDALFVMARRENHHQNTADVFWDPRT
jgi:cob(I)alamin adenosyltransferase